MIFFGNSNKYLLERKGNIFYFFQAEKKSNKKAAGREPLWASRRCPYLLLIERGRGVPRLPANFFFGKEIKRKFFFKKERNINVLFQAKKKNQKVVGTLATVSRTPQRFKGRKSLW